MELKNIKLGFTCFFTLLIWLLRDVKLHEAHVLFPDCAASPAPTPELEAGLRRSSTNVLSGWVPPSSRENGLSCPALHHCDKYNILRKHTRVQDTQLPSHRVTATRAHCPCPALTSQPFISGSLGENDLGCSSRNRHSQIILKAQ